MSSFSEAEILIVEDKEANLRLDKLLVLHFPEHSRTYFEYLIENRFVLLNGNPVKKREKPKVGDEVSVQFELLPEITLKPEPIALDILYEDEYLIAINKPRGLVVHPAPGNWTGTLVNGLLYHCKNLPATTEPWRPGIVHRLDKDTSGVIVAAKTIATHQRLVGLFSQREVRKIYLAICVGNPGTIEISTFIGRHPIHRQEMTVLEDKGKMAVSRCRPLAYDSELSLVEIELKTGRTHQARVHMKHLGTPILGDVVYGANTANKKYGLSQQLLHAEHLSCPHPITGVTLDLRAPIPQDMQSFIKRLGYVPPATKSQL